MKGMDVATLTALSITVLSPVAKVKTRLESISGASNSTGLGFPSLDYIPSVREIINM